MKTADFVTTLFDGKSNLVKATMAFGSAYHALMKGHSALVILMADAVELGPSGAMDGIHIGHPFPALDEIVQKLLAGGGRVAVCGACMIHNGFKAEDMAPGYEIINPPDVVDLLMAAKGTFPIT
jgi:predicted peroxiredoxin